MLEATREAEKKNVAALYPVQNSLLINTIRQMQQMTPSPPDKRSINAASHTRSHHTNKNRPGELVRPREDNRRHVRTEFKRVLERRLD